MDQHDKIPVPSQESPMSPSPSTTSENQRESTSPEFKPAVDFVQTSPGLQPYSPRSDRLFKRSPTCFEDQQSSCEELEKSYDLLISNLNRRMDEVDVEALFSKYGKIKSIRYYYDRRNCFNGNVDISYWHIMHAHAALKVIERIQWAPGDEPLRVRLFKRSPTCSEDQQPSCEELEKSYDLLISNLNRRMDEVDVEALFSKYGKIKSIRYYYDRRNCFNGNADISYWHIMHAHAAFKDIERIQWAPGDEPLRVRPFERSPACSHCEQPLLVFNLNKHLNEVDVKALFSEYGRVKNIKYYYDLHNCFNGNVDVSYWHIAHAYAALKDIEKIAWVSGEVQLTARLAINGLDSVNEQL